MYYFQFDCPEPIYIWKVIYNTIEIIDEYLAFCDSLGHLCLRYLNWYPSEIIKIQFQIEFEIVIRLRATDKNLKLCIHSLPKETSVGTQWTTADGLVTYEILSTDESLKTPVCNYKGLLVMKGDFKNGSFLFYYLKGFGYVGATQGSTLISFNTPDLPKRKKN